MVLDRHHRVHAGRPRQHRGVDHVVHVHQIRAQPRPQGVEIGVGPHPGVEPRDDGHWTRRTHGAVDAAHREVLLVTGRQGLEQTEKGEVGSPSVTQSIREMENPHRRRASPPPFRHDRA